MMLALGVVLVIAAIVFALLPLFWPHQSAAPPEADPLHRRAALYQEILDAELDYRLGKLSEIDYMELCDHLLGQAVLLINADPDGDVGTATSEIEAEIAAARAALGGGSLVDRLGT